MNSLSIVSLAVTLVLFLAAIFLGVQNRAETVRNRERIEALQKQMDTQAPSAGPSVEAELIAARAAEAEKTNAQVAAEAVIEGKDREIEALKAQLEAQAAEAATLNDKVDEIQGVATQPLTEMQRKIGSMPAIAKVLEVVKEGGFVILNAGRNRRLETGAEFYIRRGHYIIGKLTIGSTVEEAQCVADVDPASVPAGYHVEAGDDVIQFWQ